MASTYSTTLGIEKMGAGDQSGTWGDTTNFNWDILDRIIGYSSITLGSTSYTLDVRVSAPSSGASNVQTGMYRVLKFIDAGDLGGTATITISTSTVSAYFVVVNGLSGGRALTFQQGSNAVTYTLPNGKSALIYADGSDEVISAMANPQFTSIDTSGNANIQGSLALGTDLAVIDGGTGVGTHTDKGILYGQGTSNILATAAGTQGQFLRAGSGGTPGFETVSALNPAGSIIMYGAATPPTGYLLCDGSAVSRSTYADLFTAIGTTWGAGDGSSTFALPDLEGAFLRGTGTGTINSRSKAGPSVGSFQEDELQAHAHKISGFTGSGSGGSDKLYAVSYTTPYGGQEIHWMGHTFMLMKTGGKSGAQTVRSNDETFPYNAGVKYCIKF